MMTDFLIQIAAAQTAALHRYNLAQIGDVDGEPISIEEARAQCNIVLWGSPPESDEDFWLENIGIPGARSYCENYKGVSYAQRTMELVTDTFPSGPINLPFGPVQSIVSIKYLDQAVADAAYTAAYDAEFLISADVALATAAGEAAAAAAILVTLDPATYALDIYSTPQRINLTAGLIWPTANGDTNAVKIRYIAGPSLAGDSPVIYTLPSTAKAAILMMLAHLYANREAVNVGGIVTTMPLGVHAYLDLTPGGERLDFA